MQMLRLILGLVIAFTSIALVSCVPIDHLRASIALQPKEEVAFLNVHTQAVPPALPLYGADVIKAWRLFGSDGNGWPVLSVSGQPAVGNLELHKKGWTTQALRVGNLMRASNNNRECKKKCELVVENTDLQFCKDFYCTKQEIFTRIEHVRANVAVGDAINAAPIRANIEKPSNEAAWVYLEYVLRSTDVNGVLAQLPMHFLSFAHTWEGDISTADGRKGTWSRGGCHLLNKIDYHLSNSRWGAITNDATTTARVKQCQAGPNALPTPLTRTRVYTTAPYSGAGTCWRNAEIYSTTNTDYNNFPSQGAHMYNARSLIQSTATGVLFVGWEWDQKQDFLHHTLMQLGDQQQARKTLFPSVINSGIALLELADAVRTAMLAVYNGAPVGGVPGVNKKGPYVPPNPNFVVQSPQTYVIRVTVPINGLNVEVEGIWTEDAAPVPPADLTSRFGIGPISTLYPTLDPNFPVGFFAAPSNNPPIIAGTTSQGQLLSAQSKSNFANDRRKYV